MNYTGVLQYDTQPSPNSLKVVTLRWRLKATTSWLGILKRVQFLDRACAFSNADHHHEKGMNIGMGIPRLHFRSGHKLTTVQ
jgi:hypothetical protein